MTAISARTLQAWQRHLGHEVDPEALRAEITTGSLPEAFHASAVRRPDHPALSIDGDARTHAELDAGAGRAASVLRDRGVGPGDRVLLCAPGSIAMAELYMGILRLGASVVLANPAYTEAELRHLADDSGAILAVGGADAIARLRAIGTPVLEVGDRSVADAPALDVQPLDSRATAVIGYTSGTTGKPKAVPLTHANLLASLRSALLTWRWRDDDMLVHSLPLFHAHGLSGLQMTLVSGAAATLASSFDAETTCQMIERSQGTVLFAVPAIYERLVAHPGFRRERLGSLRLLVSGSAPLSVALSGRVERICGRRPLERYGLTESGFDVSNLYEGLRKPGAVGLPFPGVEMEVVDGDGRPVPDGTAGEIVLRGPQVFSGYRDNPEATAAAFFPGGWFRTGDIGVVDPEDGFLAITGRAKELIISGGLNVYPREVQDALEESPEVARAAVIGMPSERWGEEVVGAVVATAGRTIDAAALIAFARERLAPYKCPKRIVQLDDLPVNHMGKVIPAEVVKLVGGRVESEAGSALAAGPLVVQTQAGAAGPSVDASAEVDPADPYRWAMDGAPIIQTPRLSLRRWLPGDEAALAAIDADPEVTRYLNPPLPPAAHFIGRCMEHWDKHGFGFFAVELREEPAPGRFIGFVGIGYPAFLPELARRPELGWRLARDSWGRGLATEAALAVREDAFGRLGLDELISIIHPDNAPSRRVATKVGMRIEGVAHHSALDVDVWQLTAPSVA